MEQQVVVICSVCREPIEAGERSVECDEVGCAASRMHVACRPRCLYCGHEGCPSSGLVGFATRGRRSSYLAGPGGWNRASVMGSMYRHTAKALKTVAVDERRKVTLIAAVASTEWAAVEAEAVRLADEASEVLREHFCKKKGENDEREKIGGGHNG